MRIQLVISQSEIDALDEWRAPRKIWSRSEAIRQLIQYGMKSSVADQVPMGGAGKNSATKAATKTGASRQPSDKP